MRPHSALGVRVFVYERSEERAREWEVKKERNIFFSAYISGTKEKEREN